MRLVKKLLHRINGLHYSQEYLCFAKESFQQPLHVYLLNRDHVLSEVSAHHLFIGYSPLILALHSLPVTVAEKTDILLAFTNTLPGSNGVLSPKDALATLMLEEIASQKGSGEIRYYKGIKGKHHFISGFEQFILGLNNKLYNKKKDNVFLEGNLYKQVQVAYSVPRNISLITVQNGGQYNLFPTDLHGAAGNDQYIISLRHEGKACGQVLNSGQLTISEVKADSCKLVYSLGKNHMQATRPKDEHPFGSEISDRLKLPLPEIAIRYRELELQDSFILGIHRVMRFKVINLHQVATGETLAHIHNSYATWRYNKGLPGNYLSR
jgi:hypothetical protein